MRPRFEALANLGKLVLAFLDGSFLPCDILGQLDRRRLAAEVAQRIIAGAIVAGEPVEWEASEYFEDLIEANMSKGLILLGNEASEDPGSGEVAAWLKTFVTEAPVEWLPAGEPFWTVS